MNETEKGYFFLMRKKKKINQKEIADHLGLTQAYVSMFETGAKKLPKKHIEKYKQYILEK